MTFKITNGRGNKDGHRYDSVTRFYNDKNGNLEAEYFYYRGLINWVISYGFAKNSLAEQRKIKAVKLKKPFFNLKRGWFSYLDFKGDVEEMLND